MCNQNLKIKYYSYYKYWLNFKIFIFYIVWLIIEKISNFKTKILSGLSEICTDKLFISGVSNKTKHFINVTRDYIDVMSEIQTSNGFWIADEEKERRIENITYTFRCLAERLSEDNVLNLEKLRKALDFNILIIDTLDFNDFNKNQSMVKKIIKYQDGKYYYCDLKLNTTSTIPFDQIQLCN